MKTKICSFCNNPIPALWRSHPATCKLCAQKQATKKAQQKRAEYKHTGLKQTISGQPAKAFKAIKPVSDKMTKELAKYRKAKKEYMAEHPICEFPGCENKATDLHHAAGRLGSLLCDKSHFRSLCRPHHIWAETNPREAIKIGISELRLAI